MDVCFFELLPRGGSYFESQLFLQTVNTQLMKKRTHCTFVIISIRAEIVRLVRIKVLAHFRFGNLERT